MAPVLRDHRGSGSVESGDAEVSVGSPGKNALISRKAKSTSPLAEDPHAPEDKKRRKDHTPNTAELDAHGPQDVEDVHEGDGGHPEAEAVGRGEAGAAPGGPAARRRPPPPPPAPRGRGAPAAAGAD